MIFTLQQWQAFRSSTLQEAETSFAVVKDSFMRGQVGKSTRPWFVIDFPRLMPAETTMIGFEIETGFDNLEAKNRMMQWLWDNTDYTTVDYEGCSRYPVEITFPPIALQNLVSRDNQIEEFLAYVESLSVNDKAKTTRVNSSDPRGGCVGTHTNISTAAYRAANSTVRTQVSSRIGSLFMNLTSEQRYHLYGRQPYINDVARHRGGNGDAANRIEFKMFHTTMHRGQFANYCKVSERLAEVIDKLIAVQQGVVNDAPTTGDELFTYLTQDLDGRSVIHADNTGQYNQALRLGYGNSRAVATAQAS